MLSSSFPLLLMTWDIFYLILTFTNQVNSIFRSCFYRLHQLHSIRWSLSLDANTTLVHAMMCTRVDFGNAEFFALSSSNNLQLLICGIPRFAHFSSFLYSGLTSLAPFIQQCIQFKPLSLRCNCLIGVSQT